LAQWRQNRSSAPCADILSNTAQVLTSLAQTLEQGGDAQLLLQEAVELLQRCLTLEEFYYTEYLARDETKETSLGVSGDITIPDSNASDINEDSSDITEDAIPSRSEVEERWATVVEPVTKHTLLDTIVAQLETLTFLAADIPADAIKGLVWLEEYYTKQLKPKIQEYT
jgi:hypothetical protein